MPKSNRSASIFIITSRVPVEGKIIRVYVCDVFEIQDNDIHYYYYQPGSNIIILYFKLITQTVVIITLYIYMGYVIIRKPNFSSHEGINPHCRRFDLLLLRRFDSICGSYDHRCCRLGCRRFDRSLAINRDRSYRCFDGSLANNCTVTWVSR